MPCKEALRLTLLEGLGKSKSQEALKGMRVEKVGDHYSHEQLSLSLTLLVAWGVLRISHINDQPIAEWGVLVDKQRRPDEDTLAQCLNQIIERDEAQSEGTVAERLGQICPGGVIDMAQQESLRYGVEAGLTDGDVWLNTVVKPESARQNMAPSTAVSKP